MTNFSKFLTSHETQFYVNAMSGIKPKSLNKSMAYKDKDFQRSSHGYAHFIVQYLEDGVGDYKDYKRKYYYIIQQEIKENTFKVRADLMNHFQNTNNLYVLVITDQWACEIKSTEFYASKAAGNFHQVNYETSGMNTDLNWIHTFSINTKYAKKIDLTKVEENKDLTAYLEKSKDFIEKVAYAKYRNRKDSRGIVLTNTRTGKVTVFKSVKQCYDLFIEPNKIMGYRKFRDSSKQGQIKVVCNKSEYLIESVLCNNATECNNSEHHINTESIDESREQALLGLIRDVPQGTHNCCNNNSDVYKHCFYYPLSSTNLNLYISKFIYIEKNYYENNTDPVLGKPKRIIIRR